MSRKDKEESCYEEGYDDDDLGIDNTDYGFVISKNGELKSFFAPDDPCAMPPKEIFKIFKILKITDISELMQRSVLH